MHLFSLGVISAAIIAVAPRTRLTNTPHLLYDNDLLPEIVFQRQRRALWSSSSSLFHR